MLTLSDEQKERATPDEKRDREKAMEMKRWLDEESAKLIAKLQEQSKEQRDGK